MEEKIMDIMSTIEYGWVDKDGQKHVDDYDTYASDYRLQDPLKLQESKLGVCWDQVELERSLFEKQGKKVKTFFIVHNDNEKCPTHTFLNYQKDNKYYWFEHSWEDYRGIHSYSTMEELLLDVKNKFTKNLINSYDDSNLMIFEYTHPQYNISVVEFFDHCEKGEKVL